MKSFTKKSLSILALSLTGAVACGSFVGCSSDDDDVNGTDGGPTTDGSTGTDGSVTHDSGPGTDGSTGDGGVTDGGSDASDTGPIDAGPQYYRTGTVSFSQTLAVADYETYASASFADTLEVGSSPIVTTPLDANCTLSVYTPPAPVDAGDADAAVVDAGVIEGPEAATVTIGNSTTQFPGGAISLMPNTTTGIYTAASQYTSLTKYFAGGDTIAFAATGDAASVGAFGTTVTAPADLTQVSPASAAGAFSTDIPRGSPFAVSWHNGTLNTFVGVVLTTTTTATGAYKSLSCNFPAGPGSATVPSADLAKIDQAGATGITGRLTITPYNSATAWALVDGVDAGENADAGTNQDYLVTTTVSATPTSGSYTSSN